MARELLRIEREEKEVTDSRQPIIQSVPSEGSQLPSFQLPTVDGRLFGTASHKERWNLVLYFVDEPACPHCAEALRGLGEAYDKLSAQEAEVLVIVPASSDQGGGSIKGLGLPFPVLLDQNLSVHARYGALDDNLKPLPAIFVADRFGEIFAVSVGDAGHRLLTVDEILSWLRLIEIQCPECGAPEWAPRQAP